MRRTPFPTIALVLLTLLALIPPAKGNVISMSGFIRECSFVGVPNPGLSVGDPFSALAICEPYQWSHGDFFAQTDFCGIFLGGATQVICDPSQTIACTPGGSVFWWETYSAVLSAGPGYPELNNLYLNVSLYDFGTSDDSFLGNFDVSFHSGDQVVHIAGSTHFAGFGSYFAPDSTSTASLTALVLIPLLASWRRLRLKH